MSKTPPATNPPTMAAKVVRSPAGDGSSCYISCLSSSVKTLRSDELRSAVYDKQHMLE